MKIKDNIHAIKHNFKIPMSQDLAVERFVYSFIVFWFLLFFCNVCFAESELTEKSRKATQSDLIGRWMMIYQTVSPLFMDKSLFFAEYQIFEFSEDGFVKNLESKKRHKNEEISYLLENMPKSSVYGFIEEGVLIIERSKKDFDNIAVSIAIEDFKKELRSAAPLLRKGDLIVSYRDRKKNLYMQRYLRALPLGSN